MDMGLMMGGVGDRLWIWIYIHTLNHSMIV